MADLAALGRAAVVVEDRYSRIFALDLVVLAEKGWQRRVRPAVVADGLAELQVRWPNVPIVFCETSALAEEWTYGYLGAAQVWAATEPPAVARIEPTVSDLARAPDAPGPPTAEVRVWARVQGHRGARARPASPGIWDGWRTANAPSNATE